MNDQSTIKLQQFASDPKNSVWVFASAGSGKTRILISRVIRLLLSDVTPNKILCLTFTKVAAAEMQSRINSELASWVLCDDENLQKKLLELNGTFPTKNDLKKARSLFAQALDQEAKIKVQTIHSFCQNLIKIFPFEAKVKSNFEVIAEDIEKLMIKNSQNEVMRRAVKNPELKSLVEEINAKLRPEDFFELVGKLLNEREKLSSLLQKFLNVEGIIAEISKAFSISEGDNEQKIFANFLSQIDFQKASGLLYALEQSGLKKNIDIASSIKSFLENPIQDNFFSYQKAFFTSENGPRKIYGEPSKDKAWLNFLNDQQELILNFLDQLNSFRIYQNTATLLRFTDQILVIYTTLKQKAAYLDYNDLIIKTNELLKNPEFSDWIKLKIDSSFDHILIDESQDTNHQQWNIIKALSEDFFSGLSANNNPRSLFIVGDEKQSIYSFQGAEANISSEIFTYFQEKLSASGNKLYRVELHHSFRSLKEILKAVDLIFSAPERKIAISKASEFKTHQAIREGIGKVEIWPQIQCKENYKDKDNKNNKVEWEIDYHSSSEEIREVEILAKFIALKIKSSVEGREILLNRGRALRYGDFMILLRNRTNGLADHLTKFFHQFSIPFSTPGKINFDKNLLIQDLLSAVRFSLLVDDDLNLSCLLKSPIFSLSEEELLEICLLKNQKKCSIYLALGEIDKFQKIKKILDKLMLKAQELNCFEFFSYLLEEGLNTRVKLINYFGLESGELLDKFLLIAFDFCQNFSPNLQKFLEFIEKLDPSISISIVESNSVKISTIHSAKGLQCPIVIIPDCCYNFNQLLSAKEEISWINFLDEQLPIWCSKKTSENKLLKTHRKEKLKQAKEEYLRLLYVALTRAEDELYIGGFGNSKDPECWYEIIRNSCPASYLAMENIIDLGLNENLNETIKDKKNRPESNPNNQKDNPMSDSSNFYDLLKENIEIQTYDQVYNTSKAFLNHTNKSQLRGKLIHKILEFFGKNFTLEKDLLKHLAKNLLAKESLISKEDKSQILDETFKFLDSNLFKEIFIGTPKCEIELTGEIEKKIFSVRIDLLIERENEILIIDYKSDEILPKLMPKHYLEQLRIYGMLIKNIYPNKNIRLAICWIKFLKLQTIDNINYVLE